jgi:hypothetical protein
VHLGDGYYTVPGAVSTIASSTSMSTTSPTSSPSAPAAVSASAISKSDSSSRGLSTGAIAGISISAAIGEIVIISLIVVCAMCHRRNKQARYSAAKKEPLPFTDGGGYQENGDASAHHPVQSGYLQRPVSQDSNAYTNPSMGTGKYLSSVVSPVAGKRLENSYGGYRGREHSTQKSSVGRESVVGRQELRGNDGVRYELP